MIAIQPRRIHVDKNLYGVSAQVIESGVLVFSDIVGELMHGYAGPAETSSDSFASLPTLEGDADSRKPGAAAASHTG